MEIIFPDLEKKILEDWKKNKIFEKSILRRKKAKDFVFYEGPPTANGRPGIHHILSRSYKDIICRYKTMRGFRVLRKAGWDTHGLPVELEVEKKLGLKNKKDIEKYGIAEFNKQCKESVWQYKDEWEKLTERIGYWLDLERPYITYETNYIESVWWAIKQIYQKGLLYQDYKVVPYCPRCGTPLSSHEVAQGYQKVKDNSVYVKFPVKNQKNTYLLVWTTTPWTLPGNVAVAVNVKFNYVKIKVGDEFLILMEDRAAVLKIAGEVVEKFKGEKLIGLEYAPVFNFSKPDKKAYFAVSGDFVSLGEGTGIVHIAPAFGEDDMDVGKKNDLPVILNVDEEGKYKKEVTDWAEMRVKDANPLIIENLKKRNFLFREESYEHDYPFCWRCKSALLYYAKESWFINMQKVKKDLIKNNQGINWVPAHLKKGRFGEWLRDVKDWAFSRERYWGTPLPIWQCQTCSHREVIGGRGDLLKQKFSINNYYILRHGQTPYQKETAKKKTMYPWPENTPVSLTEEGKRQIKKSARELKSEKIDVIYCSDMFRTKQTADIVMKELGVKEIFYDARLRDINHGIYMGGLKADFYKKFTPEIRFDQKPENGETWNECKKRILSVLNEIEKKNRGKNILIISHGDPLWLLAGAMDGLNRDELLKQILVEQKYIQTGQWRKIDFKRFPYNQNGDLDFHRPYIDEVEFKCGQCCGMMRRVPDLIDVWFDSGSMPFAQTHYPFESKKIQFPADYISEAIDQTRGWFYTLLAIATLLGKGAPYKNVVSLGHVLDEKGEKMSKSKGNIVNPWDVLDKYGVDAVRWYFYTVNQPGEVKMFSDKDLQESLRKFMMIYWNSFVFFETYKQKSRLRQGYGGQAKNVLDRWIVSRLNGLIAEVTKKIDAYDITGAARAIEDFTINDLSLWYIRRSRKRFREAQNTLELVLLTLSQLTAPFIPFLSEEIYENVSRRYEKRSRSVHLTDWPKADAKLINKKLEKEMEKVRKIVALALAERAKSGIKVRQPLQKLEITEKISQELLNLIKDEINVKEVISGKTLKLDTVITPALKEEGLLREIIRQIQEMRKKAGLKPQDKISIQYTAPAELTKTLEKNKRAILTETKAKVFELAEVGSPLSTVASEIIIDQQKLCLYLATKNRSRLNK
ncbi:MAG: class I tRNA ligase family protein [Candidatus Nealsonbacteria bacterium]